MSTAVIEKPKRSTQVVDMPAQQANPLLSMLGQLATNPNFNAEAFREVVNLIREEKAGQAKSDFNAAFAAMQAVMEPAPKRGKGHNNKSYARYEDIDLVAKSAMNKHGLAINHTIHQDDNKVKIRAVLRHIGGHEESAEIILPLDTSGNKNPVQAYGSTTAYGKRYTYAALIGISAEEVDDDGQAAGGVITEAQAKTIRDAIAFTQSDEAKFKKFFKIDDIARLPAARFEDAMGMLKDKAAKQ